MSLRRKSYHPHYEFALWRIHSRRKMVGMTQEEAARAVHVSTSQFSKRERGETPLSLSELLFLCDAMKIDPGDLLRRLDDDADDVFRTPNPKHPENGNGPHS